MLTAEKIHCLRKSFAIVERQTHVAALVFYKRLFEIDPALRPLFKTDIEVQSEKLMQMLGSAISLLERPNELTPVLTALGARHIDYGVEDHHYPTVGRALLEMLESVLGNAWTDETRDAWSALYQLVADTMLQGAARARSAMGKDRSA